MRWDNNIDELAWKIFKKIKKNTYELRFTFLLVIEYDMI